ncbi:putative bifunctional diguanylate cyclase/phosphodiesterase [Euzebya tangerina]|uniref:putative bifunctional diguanylate cyclase/phosphodiesterase n=1 Tax=Euzebya tangerina TaxID=591198 RepID=UPI000E30C3A6|nr:bifunctional diguanylate cyclase/phosphodiesterase [Euzebya tangerina]
MSQTSSGGDAGARRIWLLSAALTLVALLGTGTLPTPAQTSQTFLSLAAMTGAFVIFEWQTISIRLAKQTTSLTLSEIPLVIGLFIVSPVVLVVSRVLSVLISSLLVIRQQPFKAAYNAAFMWLETLLCVVAFQLVAPSDVGDALRVSVVVLLVAIITAFGSTAAMSAAVSAYRGQLKVIRPASVLYQTFGPAFASAAFGLLTLAIWEASPWLTWAPLLTVIVLYLGYRSHIDLIHLHERLGQVLTFTRDTSGGDGDDTVLAQVLGTTRDLGGVHRAGIVAHTADGQVLSTIGDFGDRQAQNLLEGTISESDRTTTLTWPLGENSAFTLIVQTDPDGPSSSVLAGTISQIVNHASVALSNASKSAALREQAEDAARRALVDSLTGLPNRSALLKEIAKILSAEMPFATLLMDLNNFKEINDALGHSAGDDVLIEVSKRLQPMAEDLLLVSRLGGDEFAVLVAGDEAVARRTAQRILREVRRPVRVGQYSLQVDGSIGIAMYPEDGKDAVELLKHADLAMYDAKASSEKVVTFGAAAAGRAFRQLEVSTRFRDALGDREIIAAYQPQIELKTGRLVGVEALARWHDNELGQVLPEEFIRVAEQSGLLQELTDVVLDDALHWHCEWAREGLDVPVSVNVSPRSLLDIGLPRRVDRLLAHHGADPTNLTLEITESSVISDPGRSLIVLNELAELGVRLSIDDFGTGYSSLAYLQRLPVREIKIDKSFVLPIAADPDSSTPLVGGILRLCHELGFEVVAEGIETAAIQLTLETMACDRGQGFHIAFPMPPQHLPDWSRARDRNASDATPEPTY